MRFPFAVLAILTGAVLLSSQTAPPETYEELYKKVCQGRDPDSYCGRIAGRDGKAYDEETAKALMALRPVVHQAARAYGVDPRTIVGAILGEHSMNTSAKDIVQDKLVKMGLADKGVIGFGWFSKKFTFGFGQLHFERAKQAEKIAAQMEKRGMRSDGEITEYLMTPEGAVYYAAALIREAQEKYKEAGYDIKDDVPVLTTLYNIGKLEDRLARTKREGRKPSPNYFGVFVAKNDSVIREIVGDYKENLDQKDVIVRKEKAPVADDVSKTHFRATKAFRPMKSGVIDMGDTPMAFANRAFTVNAGDNFRVQDEETVDPSLGVLKLISADDGRTGYVPENVIINFAEPRKKKEEASCKLEGTAKCMDHLAPRYATTDEKTGRTRVTLQPQKPARTYTLEEKREMAERDIAAQTDEFLFKIEGVLRPKEMKESPAVKSLIERLSKFNVSEEEKALSAYAAHDLELAKDRANMLNGYAPLQPDDLVDIITEGRKVLGDTLMHAKDKKGSPHGMFLNVFNHFENCALYHHIDNPKIQALYDREGLRAITERQRSFGAVQRSVGHDPGRFRAQIQDRSDIGNLGSTYFSECGFHSDDQEMAACFVQARNRNYGATNDQCHGNKQQMIDWMKSLPTKKDPQWSDLEPSYKQLQKIFTPVISRRHLENRKSEVAYYTPNEIERAWKQRIQGLQNAGQQLTRQQEQLRRLVMGDKVIDLQDITNDVLARDRETFRRCMVATADLPWAQAFVRKMEKDYTTYAVAVISDRYYDRNDSTNQMINALGYSQSDPTLAQDYRRENDKFRFGRIESLRQQMQSARFDVDNRGRHALSITQLEQVCGVMADPIIAADLSGLTDDERKFLLENCQTQIMSTDANGHNMGMVGKTYEALRKEFGTEDQRKDHIAKLLKRMGISDSYTEPAPFTGYRDMVEKLAKMNCVSSILVSQAQMLGVEKTVYKESADVGGVEVIWGGQKCEAK